MDMKKTFETAVVGGIEVKNRIFRSGTLEGLAMNSGVDEKLLELYENLSHGGVGLIVAGFFSFSKTDHFSQANLILNDETVPGLKKMTHAVHQNGTKIVAQLNHATSQLFAPPSGPVYGPSEYTDPVSGIRAIAFSTEQIKELIQEYGTAASQAKSAGFDGVQIHVAHGYLLNKFLSPAFNQRTDEYGGSRDNNMRIVIEILNEIKTVCGSDFPVWVKLNSSDFDPESKGVTEADFLNAGEKFSISGIDAIEVSGGSMAGMYCFSRSGKHVAYHLESAQKLAEKVDASVILVGGLREINTIDSVLADTKIEAVALSRALIREPDLANKWMNKEQDKAKCVACNGCFNPKGVRCFFDLTAEEKEEQKPMMQMMNANS